jgi:hypothetical protein
MKEVTFICTHEVGYYTVMKVLNEVQGKEVKFSLSTP